jgi:hypothetical protein
LETNLKYHLGKVLRNAEYSKPAEVSLSFAGVSVSTAVIGQTSDCKKKSPVFPATLIRVILLPCNFADAAPLS